MALSEKKKVMENPLAARDRAESQKLKYIYTVIENRIGVGMYEWAYKDQEKALSELFRQMKKHHIDGSQDGLDEGEIKRRFLSNGYVILRGNKNYRDENMLLHLSVVPIMDDADARKH